MGNKAGTGRKKPAAKSSPMARASASKGVTASKAQKPSGRPSAATKPSPPPKKTGPSHAKVAPAKPQPKLPPVPPLGKQARPPFPPKPVDKSKPGAPPPVDAKKIVRKGITIVSNKPVKKPKVRTPPPVLAPLAGQLLKPGGPKRKPLIPSGPGAPVRVSLGMSDEERAKVRKSPFDKRELARYKAILLKKRSELIGDVNTMEREALKGESGSLSNLPQHMAEQGSEAYDQALTLDLAAADRRLIKEIDDALARIENGSFGLCELTGKPIRPERLEELPWARYSIEAARELERRSIGL